MSLPVDPTTFILDVFNVRGVPLRVIAYAPGATGPYPAAADPARALIEFYDRRYPHTEHGQFTGGRYDVETLQREPVRGGINLHGGVHDWFLNGAAWTLVETWLASLPASINLRINRVSLDSRKFTDEEIERVRSGLCMRQVGYGTGRTLGGIEWCLVELTEAERTLACVYCPEHEAEDLSEHGAVLRYRPEGKR